MHTDIINISLLFRADTHVSSHEKRTTTQHLSECGVGVGVGAGDVGDGCGGCGDGCGVSVGGCGGRCEGCGK